MKLHVSREPCGLFEFLHLMAEHYEKRALVEPIAPGVELRRFTAPDLMFNAGLTLPIVVVHPGAPPLIDSQYDCLRDRLDGVNCALLFYTTPGVPPIMFRSLEHLAYVHFEAARILPSPGVSVPAKLQEFLRAQIPLKLLSPYVPDAVAVGPAFFDRKQVLRGVLRRPPTSMLIAGIRRIGKTSLLRKIRELLEQRGHSVAMIAANTVDTTEELLSLVVSRLDLRRVQKVWQVSQLPSFFREVMIRSQDCHPVLLLDEAGPLIMRDKDEGWRFFRALKAAVGEGVVQLIVAGSPEVLEHSQLYASPLFNVASRVVLEAFAYEDASQMVIGPMTALGLDYIARQQVVVTRIVRETGGFPNFIQYYCDWIVRAASEGRQFAAQDLDAIYDDVGFRNYVLETFMKNASDAQIALLFAFCAIAAESNASYRAVDLAANASILPWKWSVGYIDQLASGLQGIGVLGKRGGAYFLAVPVLWTLVHRVFSERAVLLAEADRILGLASTGPGRIERGAV